MRISERLIKELQNRLKLGNRLGVHLNALPAGSRYKFDLSKLSIIKQGLPDEFIQALLTEQQINSRISRENNIPDLNSFSEDIQEVFNNK